VPTVGQTKAKGERIWVDEAGDPTGAAVSRLSLVAFVAALGAALLTIPFAAALLSVIRLWDWNFSRFSDNLIGLGVITWLTLTAVGLVLGIVQLLRPRQRRGLPALAAVLAAASLLVIVSLSVAANRAPSYRIEPSSLSEARPGQAVAALEVHGFLVTSADGGATWATNDLEASGTTVVPWRFAFSDARRGWVVDRFSGVVLATGDGGSIWTPSTVPGVRLFDAVTCDDAGHVWAAGRGSKNRPFLAASRDGGANWTVRAVPGRGALTSLSFPDPRHGWALLGDTSGDLRQSIMATSDGGLHWRMQLRLTYDITGLRQIAFADARRGWAVGTRPASTGSRDVGVVLATEDGGATWRIQHEAPRPLLCVTWTDAEHAWVAGEGGLVLTTSDGGETWREQRSGTSKALTRVSFSDSQHGWVLAGREALLATSDGGYTWEPIDMGPGGQGCLRSVA
jgi:photosystem II stability/assembly factor-like uncharacterized protein